MPVVRYVALAALVFWLGGATQALGGDAARYTARVAYACGAVLALSLLIMKFVGPPPRAFPIRIALVALMVAATTVGLFSGRQTEATMVALGLGAVLLSWYARE